ncbi:MAG: hypothetical protein F4Z62_08415 [Rhodothermaceae bacterium]|nr:hypothetical protein [Rhodothermaceae bacterium]MXW33114.1 hypothetical protein [Rhodothermaceae bacterium]MYE64275.1 hypothetical protein [Rhodothermaceae bacterium]
MDDYTGMEVVDKLHELTEVMKIVAIELRRIRNVLEVDKDGGRMGDYLHPANMGDDLGTALPEALNWKVS